MRVLRRSRDILSRSVWRCRVECGFCKWIFRGTLSFRVDTFASQGTELYNAWGAAGNEIPPMRASHAFRSEIAQKSSETNATNLTAFEQLIRSI